MALEHRLAEFGPRYKNILIMVFLGGYSVQDEDTQGIVERKRKEVTSVPSSMLAEIVSNQPPLAFGDGDLLHGRRNERIPRVVRATMENCEVWQILVN